MALGTASLTYAIVTASRNIATNGFDYSSVERMKG